MILERYLKNNNSNIKQMCKVSGIPETTLRDLNKKTFEKWKIKYIDAIAIVVGKSRKVVLDELEDLHNKSFKKYLLFDKYNIENRRYLGNKSKIIGLISELIDDNTKGTSFFDVFAGTGVVSKKMSTKYDKLIINDFLYSNNAIYKAFFENTTFNSQKLYKFKESVNLINPNNIENNYFSKNFGEKFFSNNDAKIIGEIREQIEKDLTLNPREYYILIASLIYSCDKIANTVGHYDAYRKTNTINDRFKFELINIENMKSKDVVIYREDANNLVRKVKADIAFIDPPYNSRQYSRFYHLLENLTKWKKPELSGVAMKPPVENMSEYSKVSAPKIFDDLIQNLNAKYIVVTYNNTYKPKSSSSKNKITHEQILESLEKVGKTKIFEIPFQFFNAGKSDLKDHKEFVFITEVDKKI